MWLFLVQYFEAFFSYQVKPKSQLKLDIVIVVYFESDVSRGFGK